MGSDETQPVILMRAKGNPGIFVEVLLVGLSVIAWNFFNFDVKYFPQIYDLINEAIPQMNVST